MNRILETNDIFKSAYLLSRSFILRETRFVDSHQVRFVIEGENIDIEDRLYHAGKALAEPLRLKSCLDLLRDKLNQTLKTHTSRRPNVTYSRRGNRTN